MKCFHCRPGSPNFTSSRETTIDRGIDLAAYQNIGGVAVGTHHRLKLLGEENNYNLR